MISNNFRSFSNLNLLSKFLDKVFPPAFWKWDWQSHFMFWYSKFPTLSLVVEAQVSLETTIYLHGSNVHTYYTRLEPARSGRKAEVLSIDPGLELTGGGGGGWTPHLNLPTPRS